MRYLEAWGALAGGEVLKARPPRQILVRGTDSVGEVSTVGSCQTAAQHCSSLDNGVNTSHNDTWDLTLDNAQIIYMLYITSIIE